MWHLYDGKWQNPLDSADRIVPYLDGSSKPIFHPLSKYDKTHSLIHTATCCNRFIAYEILNVFGKVEKKIIVYCILNTGKAYKNDLPINKLMKVL